MLPECLPDCFPGIRLLMRANQYAREAGVDRWQFAVELHHLLNAGLTVCDCRRLVTLGLARHAREVTDLNGAERCFDPNRSLALSDDSCFVLTDSGAAFAHETTPEWNRLELKPRYDAETRELLMRDQVVKRFKQRANNQEMILLAFEEEDWPVRIDDPLPCTPTCPRQRLGEAVRRLNRHQKAKLISFMRDGTGEGICWQPTRDDVNAMATGASGDTCDPRDSAQSRDHSNPHDRGAHGAHMER